MTEKYHYQHELYASYWEFLILTKMNVVKLMLDAKSLAGFAVKNYKVTNQITNFFGFKSLKDGGFVGSYVNYTIWRRGWPQNN